MRKRFVICEKWSIIVVPFPFVDHKRAKRRPALVLSNEPFNRGGHTVLSMITTKAKKAWPGDCAVRDLGAAGLRVECIVRLKLFTMDNRLILRQAGKLSEGDASRVAAAVSRYLN